jgi:hypothetical protein
MRKVGPSRTQHGSSAGSALDQRHTTLFQTAGRRCHLVNVPFARGIHTGEASMEGVVTFEARRKSNHDERLWRRSRGPSSPNKE